MAVKTVKDAPLRNERRYMETAVYLNLRARCSASVDDPPRETQITNDKRASILWNVSENGFETPDLEQSKSAVVKSLTSRNSQRTIMPSANSSTGTARNP